MKFTDLLQQSDAPVQDDPFIEGDGEDNTPSYIRDQTPIKGKSTATIISEGVGQFGEAVAEDPVGVAKAIGTGIYEVGKEFVQNPVETTTEFVSSVGQSIANVGTNSLNDYLPEGVTEDSATADEMTQARQDRLSDYLNASIVVPAAGGVVKIGTSLSKVLPELEVDANALGSMGGNIKIKKDKVKDSDLNDENLDTLNEELMSVAAYQAANMGKNGAPPLNSIKGYKLFRINRETGELFPLYVDAKTAIPLDTWVPAIAGELAKSGKVKSEIGELAYRPGFHAAQLPWVNHIGSKFKISKKTYDKLKADGANNLIVERENISITEAEYNQLKAAGETVSRKKNKKGEIKYTKAGETNYFERLRDEDTVWAEIELPNDVDWQSEAIANASIRKDGSIDPKTAHITDQIPDGGFYYYNTKAGNPNQWLIGGSMKINRILDDAEVEQINMEADVLGSDMPRNPYSKTDTVPATVAEQTEDLLGNRISTRVPTKGTKENKVILPETYNRDLVIDTDVMREAGTLDKNVDFLATRRDGSSNYDGVEAGRYFPAFKGLEKLDPEARVEYVEAMQKKNLEFILDKLPKEFQDRTKVWYEGANRISEELSNKYGVPQSAMSATIAALSPQMDWFSNVSLAERVVDVVTNRRNMPFTTEMEEVSKRYPVFLKEKNRPIFESIKGKTYAELETDMQKAMWVRAYDQAYNPRTHRSITPEGELGEIILNANGKPKAVSWGSFTEISKAVKSIESNGDLNIISDALGEMHKVRNFYNNIEVPFSDFGDITIDTHAIAAGYMKPLGGSDPLVSQGLGTAGSSSAPYGAQGIYGLTADVYRDVADDRGLMPRETQSIVWEAVRTLMDDKKTLPNKQKVNQIWNAYDRGDLTQEQALNLIEETFGSFPQRVIDPNEKRTIREGASTMFNKGGLVTGLMSPEEI
jgi:hypothetical protein